MIKVIAVSHHVKERFVAIFVPRAGSYQPLLCLRLYSCAAIVYPSITFLGLSGPAGME